MAKKKTAPKKGVFSPFLLSLAGAAAWAATHTPARFNAVDVVAAWLITALAVGLLIRAFLALLGPVFKLIGDFLRHTVNPSSTNDQNDA